MGFRRNIHTRSQCPMFVVRSNVSKIYREDLSSYSVYGRRRKDIPFRLSLEPSVFAPNITIIMEPKKRSRYYAKLNMTIRWPLIYRSTQHFENTCYPCVLKAVRAHIQLLSLLVYPHEPNTLWHSDKDITQCPP